MALWFVFVFGLWVCHPIVGASIVQRITDLLRRVCGPVVRFRFWTLGLPYGSWSSHRATDNVVADTEHTFKMSSEQRFVKLLNNAAGQTWKTLHEVVDWLSSYTNVLLASQQQGKTVRQWFRWWSLQCHPDKVDKECKELAKVLFQESQNRKERKKNTVRQHGSSETKQRRPWKRRTSMSQRSERRPRRESGEKI